jgi:hypothetical protein
MLFLDIQCNCSIISLVGNNNQPEIREIHSYRGYRHDKDGFKPVFTQFDSETEEMRDASLSAVKSAADSRYKKAVVNKKAAALETAVSLGSRALSPVLTIVSKISKSAIN